MTMKAREIDRDPELHGPSRPLIWGANTLTRLQREERLRREAWLASQPELSAEELTILEAAEAEADVCLSRPWTPELATLAIKWHEVSGETQSAFAQAHGFPVSRFRSKVARKARAAIKTNRIDLLTGANQ
jgi:hypothetical protein